MSNSEFVNLMSNADDRPAWSKVRWINIGGISWDVLSALAIKYGERRREHVTLIQYAVAHYTIILELHPLALEDLLTNRGHSRSKADYYTKHLALRILCHAVVPDEDTTSLKDIAPEKPRSSSPTPMSEDDEKALDEKFSDEGTMYGGSPPISRFSTKRKGASTMRRRGAGHWTGDIENSSTPSTPSFFNKPSPRPVAVSFRFCTPSKSICLNDINRQHEDSGTRARLLKLSSKANVSTSKSTPCTYSSAEMAL